MKIKYFTILALSILVITGCTRKVPDEVIAEYEYTIKAQGVGKVVTVSRVCKDYTFDKELCDPSPSSIKIKNYFCDLGGNLYILLDGERLPQPDFKCSISTEKTDHNRKLTIQNIEVKGYA